MDIYFFIKGFLIGFSIAAPVGPIGILCIQRTITKGALSGFVSGMGAATADGFYGCIAAFGLTAVSGVLTGQQFWFRLIGGAYLLYLGIKTLTAKKAESAFDAGKNRLAGDYFSTLFLTITNPVTILSFIAIFAGLGLSQTKNDYFSALTMVAGVISGSAFWWFLLSGGVSLFRSRFNDSMSKAVNIVSGTIIIAFALAALGSIFR